MRLGLIIYGSLDTLSGGYLYDRKLVEYLHRVGDEVEIISLPWRSYVRHLADNLSRPLQQRLAAGRWDILLQDELNHPSLFRLNRALKNHAQHPIVAIVHHLRSSEARPRWQNRFYRQVEKQYLDGMDGFIYNSRATRAAVAAIAPGAISRPSVAAHPAGNRFGNSMDADKIALRSALPGPLKIIFVGNLIPRKGLPTLLDAVERTPENACMLRVVGGGDPKYEQQVRRRIQNTRLSGQVHLDGRLTDSDLAAALLDSHVLCVPSSYEGFGIVYLEGMGFGLPAIAGASGAGAEVVADGEDGFLIPTGDADALADRLLLLAGDRKRLCEMSLAARRRFQAHPTWDETAERIRRFLNERLGV